MALYTVAAGDTIWDIADRSLGLQRGTNTPPATVQEVADEMLRIITTNMGKLKVPKGSKGTPGAADLIHAGLVLDLGGPPTPSEAAKNGQQSGGHPKDPGGSMSGYNPPAQNSAPSGGREPGPQPNPGAPTGGREPGWGGRTPNPGAPNPGWGGREPANSSGRNPGASSGGREPGPAQNPGNPSGGREPVIGSRNPAAPNPGWGGREPAESRGRAASSRWGGREPGPTRNSARTGGREPGWGGRDNGPQREIRPQSPRPNPGSPTGGREPGWGGPVRLWPGGPERK